MGESCSRFCGSLLALMVLVLALSVFTLNGENLPVLWTLAGEVSARADKLFALTNMVMLIAVGLMVFLILQTMTLERRGGQHDVVFAVGYFFLAFEVCVMALGMHSAGDASVWGWLASNAVGFGMLAVLVAFIRFPPEDIDEEVASHRGEFVTNVRKAQNRVTAMTPAQWGKALGQIALFSTWIVLILSNPFPGALLFCLISALVYSVYQVGGLQKALENLKIRWTGEPLQTLMFGAFFVVLAVLTPRLGQIFQPEPGFQILWVIVACRSTFAHLISPLKKRAPAKPELA